MESQITSLRTAKEYESQLTPGQLDALSQSGCKAEHGALLTMQVDQIVGAKIVEIFNTVSSKDEARARLIKLCGLDRVDFVFWCRTAAAGRLDYL